MRSSHQSSHRPPTLAFRRKALERFREVKQRLLSFLRARDATRHHAPPGLCSAPVTADEPGIIVAPMGSGKPRVAGKFLDRIIPERVAALDEDVPCRAC